VFRRHLHVVPAAHRRQQRDHRLGNVVDTSLAPLEATGQSGAERLARFFSDVARLDSEQVFALSQAGSSHPRETVVVEFAGPKNLIFSCAISLEFGDRIRLQDSSGNKFEAKVIAVRYQDGRTAVAAQILNGQLSGASRP